MFGFSIYKILFTIAVIVVVWQSFKWLKRRENMMSGRSRKFFGSGTVKADDDVEDLVWCPKRKAYVPKEFDDRRA